MWKRRFWVWGFAYFLWNVWSSLYIDHVCHHYVKYFWHACHKSAPCSVLLYITNSFKPTTYSHSQTTWLSFGNIRYLTEMPNEWSFSHRTGCLVGRQSAREWRQSAKSRWVTWTINSHRHMEEEKGSLWARGGSERLWAVVSKARPCYIPHLNRQTAEGRKSLGASIVIAQQICPAPSQDMQSTWPAGLAWGPPRTSWDIMWVMSPMCYLLQPAQEHVHLHYTNYSFWQSWLLFHGPDTR